MIRIFRATDNGPELALPWSFSYTDWRGRRRIGAGTESKVETQRLAEQVQAEHDLLRDGMRRTPEGTTAPLPMEMLGVLEGLDRPTPPSPAAPPRQQPVDGGARAPQRTAQGHSPAGRVGEQLVESGLITPERLAKGLDYQKEHGGKLVDALIHLDFLTPEEFLTFMGNRPGVPRIVINNYNNITDEVLSLIPGEMAAELEVIPIDRLGKILSVAMVCPIDQEALKTLRRHTGINVQPLLCSRGEFRDALQRFYGKSAGTRLRKR